CRYILRSKHGACMCVQEHSQGGKESMCNNPSARRVVYGARSQCLSSGCVTFPATALPSSEVWYVAGLLRCLFQSCRVQVALVSRCAGVTGLQTIKRKLEKVMNIDE
ncbi:hypothetical protein JI435_047010, partial [Parastagonospora nodorum SN15]